MATASTSANTDFLNTSATSQPDGKTSVVDNVNNSLKKFGDSAAGQLGKLSTTQKVVGGLALAAGISWLSKAMSNRNS